MKSLVYLSVLIISMALLACAGNTVNMEVVYRSSQCHSVPPGLISIKNKTEYEEIIASHMSFNSQRSATAPADLNFETKHVVLIAMGEKSTAGYRLQIENNAPKLTGNTLFLPVQFKDPVGDRQAQVVTSPCLVISLDKGTYQLIRAHTYSLSL